MKIKDWVGTAKEIISIKKISEVNFSSRNYISAEKKPSVSSFGEAEYEEQSIIYFNILNGLL